jgi:N-acetylmuramoyl-L-alanine amidase
MKRKYFIAFIFFELLINGQAISQDFSGIKICIDPGHGAYGPNDRNIPDVGFWESESNWIKANQLKQILTAHNANVILTRNCQGTGCDISLSSRVAIANQNNSDFFHSIHSNAANQLANYTLLLFRGLNDNSPENPLAKQMGAIMSVEIYNVHRTTASYNRADYSFLGYHLGVLNGLNMPGTLSEGSFHDYRIECWRLMNNEYKKHEAWAIARSFQKFYNKSAFGVGIVAGILRDKDKNNTLPFNSSLPNDKFLPLNGIKVTLKELNKVYYTDNYNNGFYFFDSLQPGTYKVIFENVDYDKDSVTLVVKANETVFGDKFLNYNTSLPPFVVSYQPASLNDSIRVFDQIQITFSREMNIASVQNAFSTNPPSQGTFGWSDNNKILSYKPIGIFQKATVYTVTIDTSAKSFFNVKLTQPFSFQFVTKNKDRLLLLKNFPRQNLNNVAETFLFKLYFNGSINNASFVGKLFLYDKNNQKITLKNLKIENKNNIGLATFEPKDPLIRGEEYRLELSPTVNDVEGYTLLETHNINFRITQSQIQSGTILNNFSNLSEWKQPRISTGSIGIDTTKSKFEILAERFYSSSTSGKLTYSFLQQSNARAIVKLNNPIDISSNKLSVVVYGDDNGNTLSFILLNDGSEVNVKVDSLDWTGWKIVSIDLNSLGMTGSIKFVGISVDKTNSGEKDGVIYVDDLQIDASLKSEENIVFLANEFELFQNYPNPFNPSTTISFYLPKAGVVNLEIYNLLGKKIDVLLDKAYLNAGFHRISFDIKDKEFPSGVYFYKLTFDNQIKAKKMLLIK